MQAVAPERCGDYGPPERFKQRRTEELGLGREVSVRRLTELLEETTRDFSLYCTSIRDSAPWGMYRSISFYILDPRIPSNDIKIRTQRHEPDEKISAMFIDYHGLASHTFYQKIDNFMEALKKNIENDKGHPLLHSQGGY